MTTHRIYFLTKELDTDLALFTTQLLNNKYDISSRITIIIVEDKELKDKDAYELDFIHPLFNSSMYIDLGTPMLFNASDQYCLNRGFYGCNIDGKTTSIKKQVIAIDKMFLAMNEDGKNYDYTWVFEDDVFFPSIESLFNLIDIEKGQYDLICPTINEKKDNLLDWHWQHVFENYKAKKYFAGMMCGFGMSDKLWNKISDYRHEYNHFFHHEAMIPTIAINNDLKVYQAPALSTIFWTAPWDLKNYITMPFHVFHPVKKDKYSHGQLRQLMNHCFSHKIGNELSLPKDLHESVKMIERIKIKYLKDHNHNLKSLKNVRCEGYIQKLDPISTIDESISVVNNEENIQSVDWYATCLECLGSGCRYCDDKGLIKAKCL